jgi:DMSO/TMAO reductase YedYZ molybdopterin-dependent catalytic subunit
MRSSVAISKVEGAVPDFLRMDQPVSSDPANAKKTGDWHGWPTKDINPVMLADDEGRTVRIRTPVMDLEGLITPTPLHYTVQHFAVPPVVQSADWELKIVGEVKTPLALKFDQFTAVREKRSDRTLPYAVSRGRRELVDRRPRV